MSESILRVEDLKIHFPLKASFDDTIHRRAAKTVKAVDGVSFEIRKGETLALVGESGCGKTTIGKALVRLNTPTGGQILYKDVDIFKQDRKAYSKQVQYIFQDPYSSLNPQMSVMDIVRRPLDIFDLYPRQQREKRALQLLDMVGIASNQVYRYPHEFSGGQRQRISIARALAVEPEMLVADEPTSALDVSIQCQVLDLLGDLRKELNLTMLFISHDLGVVNYISDYVVIMYLGHIIERGKTKEVFKNPMHPYSKALLAALPVRGATKHERTIRLEGYIPSPINPPSGCLLHPRCPYAQQCCKDTVPEMIRLGDGHSVGCLFAEKQNFEARNIIL